MTRSISSIAISGFVKAMLPLLRHAGPRHAPGVVRPALGQEQPQTHHHRHLARGQRQRDQRLTIGGLAKRRGILRRDADRMAPFFGSAVSSTIKPGIRRRRPACRLRPATLLQAAPRPKRRCRRNDEAGRSSQSPVARRHRLDTLAIPGADQTRNIGRTHPRPRLVSAARGERRQASDRDHLLQFMSMVGPP